VVSKTPRHVTGCSSVMVHVCCTHAQTHDVEHGSCRGLTNTSRHSGHSTSPSVGWEDVFQSFLGDASWRWTKLGNGSSPIFCRGPRQPSLLSSFSVCRPVVTHGSGRMSILEQFFCDILCTLGFISLLHSFLECVCSKYVLWTLLGSPLASLSSF
jgi:hypothetical protein